MWYNLTLEYVPQRVPRGAERVFTMGLFTKLFGTRSEREVKKLEPQVEAVMALEEPYKKLTDQELRAKTQEFKDRYASGETLDALLPEAPQKLLDAGCGEGWYLNALLTPTACSVCARTGCRSWAASCCIRAASPK